jgi:phosphatidylglycerol lysyltransferase
MNSPSFAPNAVASPPTRPAGPYRPEALAVQQASAGKARSAVQLRLRWAASLFALGSGAVNLVSVIGPPLHERVRIMRRVFPFEFVHLSRFAVLLIGFALIVSSVNLYRRKRRAFHSVLIISALSVLFHLTKGLDYEEAALSAALFAFLWLARNEFTVQSSFPDMQRGALGLLIAFLAALFYGVCGFWLLDKREFGINFTIGDAVHRTLLFLSLVGDPGVTPRTHYAAWFVRSLYLLTGTAMAYAVIALFRPVVYRYRTLPSERDLARSLTRRYGRSSLDYFKCWPDKSFVFSPSRESFIAYKVGGGYAMALADPVGPEAEVESMIRHFVSFCGQNDWGVAFHQTLPDFLPIYRKLGFRKLKIGDDAIVNLTRFGLEGKEYRKLRNRISALEKLGIGFLHYEPPLSAAVLAQMKTVSDAWLEIPGRRERTFALGQFDADYLRHTPIYAAVDNGGTMLAFVNLVPSFAPGEATIDLMRHRVEAPSGMMDYVFAKLLLELQTAGYRRFNMGMAPMAGFQEHEEATPEERAVHAFMQHMSFLFSYRGLRNYKAKFATSWEPRYVVYRNVLNLPRVARAILEVSEIHD